MLALLNIMVEGANEVYEMFVNAKSWGCKVKVSIPTRKKGISVTLSESASGIAENRKSRKSRKSRKNGKWECESHTLEQVALLKETPFNSKASEEKAAKLTLPVQP